MKAGEVWMTDIEKVRRALEICSTAMSTDLCSQCPYKQFGMLCKTSMMRDALALLRDCEPVEPCVQYYWESQNENYSDDINITEYTCGRCGRLLHEDDSFCADCGRKIKWQNDRIIT